MADQFTEYKPIETLGQGPQPAVRGIPLPGVPNMPDVGGADRALSEFGKELGAVTAKLQEGAQHTAASQAMEGFLTQRADLQQKYIDDPEYATAEGRFKDDIEKIKRDALGTISDPVIRERTSLEMTRDVITSSNKVRVAQTARQVDFNVAAADTSQNVRLNEAATAGSPQERAAAIDHVVAENQRLASAGWIDQVTAVKRIEAFKSQLSGADALLAVNRNPKAAIALLNNPEAFPGLDPTRRASMMIAAEQRLDSLTQGAVEQAARFHSEAASLSVGRVIATDHVQKIFENGIIKIESGGDPAAVSNKGALGLAQLMPDTAREMATKLKMTDVAGLGDAELKARLLSDTELNKRLGSAYLKEMVTRYDGNLPLAIVAYNAGPGRADVWKTKAQAQFGVDFSAAQLASVVDIKESRDYLGKLYGRFNAPMDVAFSSPIAAQTAVNAVGSILAQQDARETQITKALATAAHTGDPVPDNLLAGYAQDPMLIANYRAAQTAAASKGDTTAAGRLRELDFGERMLPMIQQARRTPPVELDAQIARTEAAFAAPGASPTQDQINALKAFKTVRDDIVNRRNSDPVSLGERGGLYPSIAVDPTASPDDPNFRAALAQRGVHARIASQTYMGSSVAFKPEEAAALKERYTDASPDDKFRLVKSLADTLPDKVYRDTLRQVVGDDGTTEFVGQIARTRPELAREIFKGQQLAQTEGVKNKMGDVRNALTNKLGGQIYVSAEQQGAVVDAALALYTARRGTAGGLYEATDTGAIEKAIEDVAGPIVKRNGVRTPAPPGMTAGQFTGILDGLTDQSFDQFGGAYDRSGKPYSGSFLSSRAVLKQLEPGGSKYVVVLPQGAGGKDVPVWQAPDPNVANRPLVIDMAVMKNTRPEQLSAYQRGRAGYRGEINDRIQQTRLDTEGVAP